MDLKTKIKKMYKSAYDKKGEKPLYVDCCIEWFDNKEHEDVKIKLSLDEDNDDDSIFYYCDSLKDLLSLIIEGKEDFKIIEVNSFFN